MLCKLTTYSVFEDGAAAQCANWGPALSLETFTKSGHNNRKFSNGYHATTKILTKILMRSVPNPSIGDTALSGHRRGDGKNPREGSSPQWVNDDARLLGSWQTFHLKIAGTDTFGGMKPPQRKFLSKTWKSNIQLNTDKSV
jgi:hypothetical protein